MDRTINACAQKLKMAGRAKWKDFLKNELEKSPLASNLFFGFILTLLEKLVELEFSCPCGSHAWNGIFASAFFILPPILSLVLMMCIRGYKSIESVWQCCIPPLMWLTLIFLDGQYLACAMTDWSGSYRIVPQSAHQKWCKPDNTSNEPSEELLRMTQHWFTVSQFTGMVFVGLFSAALGYKYIYIRTDQRQANVASSGNDNQERSENASYQMIEIS